MTLVEKIKGLPKVQNLESEIAKEIARTRKVPEEVAVFAPPIHPDRVSQVTRTMCEAINRIYEDTSAQIDKRVAEFARKVEELHQSAHNFKMTMRDNSDHLIDQVKQAMAQYEDITSKMQESSFAPKIIASQGYVEVHNGDDAA